MKHPIRVITIALALAASPACAALAPFTAPVVAAQTLDQRAYALLHTYAAVIEEAADVVRDPAAPDAVKRALARAEAAATPAAEVLAATVSAYLRARAEYDAAGTESATLAFAIAAQRLGEAIETARGPIEELTALVAARGS